MAEAGCDAIKLEGRVEMAERLAGIVIKSGIPAMGHLGLTPQSASALGGFHVQGKNALQAKKFIDDAKALEEAGAFAILLEMAPDRVCRLITTRAKTCFIFRHELGFEEVVRFEHHITETWKSIVRQPYQRRGDLLELAGHVANISAKHEGGDPEVELKRQHPSDIFDYFRSKEEINAGGDWEALTMNFLDKFDAVNNTAWALTERGLSFIAAPKLHR